MTGALLASAPAANGVAFPANNPRSWVTSHLKPAQASSANVLPGAPKTTTRKIEMTALRFIFFAWASTFGDVQIRQRAVEGFRSKRDRFRQRGMGVNGQADVGGIGAHFDRQCHFGDQVAGIGADDARADNAAALLVEQ